MAMTTGFNNDDIQLSHQGSFTTRKASVGLAQTSNTLNKMKMTKSDFGRTFSNLDASAM